MRISIILQSQLAKCLHESACINKAKTYYETCISSALPISNQSSGFLGQPKYRITLNKGRQSGNIVQSHIISKYVDPKNVFYNVVIEQSIFEKAWYEKLYYPDRDGELINSFTE